MHVDRKSMSEARLGVVEPERKFVELEPAISRILPAVVAQCLHGWRLHRRKTLRYFERLLQGFRLIDTGDRRGHRQTHRVSQSFFAGEYAFLYRIAVATNRLHPQHSD